jgi:ABC-type amino acid transport substrate-binding protein
MVALVTFFSLAPPPTFAQDGPSAAPEVAAPEVAMPSGVAEGTVTVGVAASPPFVMFDENGDAEGLSIDLWQLLADELDLDTEIARFETFRALIEAVEAGEVDVAVTNVTITEDRHRVMDFTQPWFDAGLRIMTDEASGTGFRALVAGLSDAGHLEAYAWLAFVIVAATVGFTLFDRRFDKDFHPRWRDGVAHSFHTVMQIAMTGRMPARKNLFGWLGRIWQAFWPLFGLAVVAYVTSSIASVMTTLAVIDQINGPDDLPGRRVAVFEGTVAEEFGQRLGFDIRPYPGIEEAAAGLSAGEVDAVVADAPVLEYHAFTNPGLGLSVVGPIFEPDKYGFALPLGSPLTRDLTVQLLSLWEAGTIRQLDTDYFGHSW